MKNQDIINMVLIFVGLLLILVEICFHNRIKNKFIKALFWICMLWSIVTFLGNVTVDIDSDTDPVYKTV